MDIKEIVTDSEFRHDAGVLLTWSGIVGVTLVGLWVALVLVMI